MWVSDRKNMPEEHQFQALGAEAMGTADDRDRAVIAEMDETAKLADFMDWYWVSSGRGTSSLPMTRS